MSDPKQAGGKNIQGTTAGTTAGKPGQTTPGQRPTAAGQQQGGFNKGSQPGQRPNTATGTTGTGSGTTGGKQGR